MVIYVLSFRFSFFPFYKNVIRELSFLWIITDLSDTNQSQINKVHIFWEGHKILRNLHLTFEWHYLGKIKVKISKKFVAFSEYMNFNPISRKGQIKTTTSTRLPWIFRPSYGTILCGLLYYIETHYTQAEATKLFKVSEMGWVNVIWQVLISCNK